MGGFGWEWGMGGNGWEWGMGEWGLDGLRRGEETGVFFLVVWWEDGGGGVSVLGREGGDGKGGWGRGGVAGWKMGIW